MYGFPSETFPEPVSVNVNSMLEKFKVGVEQNKDYWYSLLPQKRVKKLEDIARLSRREFNLPGELWAKTVYDFATAYRTIHHQGSPGDNKDACDRLVLSFVPIYFGRTASFVRETKNMSNHQAERVIDKLCQSFQETKPYLVERWSAKE